MALAVVGSIAFDTVKTPFGEVKDELGGAATHAALTASFFTKAAVVGVVGDDFTPEHARLFLDHGIDVSDLERVSGQKTLAWTVRYEYDLNLPQPEELHLNVFDGWRPKLSPKAAGADILYLGAMDPEAQIEVRSQWQGSKWAVLDTLTYWIDTKRDALVEAIGGVDIVLLNDQEVRQLTQKTVLLQAAREIQSWGPRAVVVKHGEYGCSLLTEDGYFALPGYPLESAIDPTGTGDSFAGGLLGYLDLAPAGDLSQSIMRRAVTYGSVMASFCVEEFGTNRTARLTKKELDRRFEDFRLMTHFERLPTSERPNQAEETGERRIDRPHLTPSTQGYDSPDRTPSIQIQESPARTPSTEALHLQEKPIQRGD